MPSQYQSITARQQHQQFESPYTDLMKFTVQVKETLDRAGSLEQAGLLKQSERISKSARAITPEEPIELPLDLNQVTTQSFIEQLTFDKAVLLKVHDAIRTLPEVDVERLVDVALPQLQKFTTHRLAGSVIQRLVARSQKIVSALSALTDDSIAGFFNNEQASKVLQSVVQRSAPFRARLLTLIEKRWSDAICTVPGVFLICACIGTCTDPLELRWIYNNLIHKSSKLITSKYQKRILLTFLDLCTPAQQAEVCKKVLEPVGLLRILRDKYLTSMVVTLINKGDASTCAMLANAFKKSFEELQHTTFYKFMIARLNLANAHSSLLDILLQTVNRVTREQPFPISLQDAENFVQLAAVVATAEDHLSAPDSRWISMQLTAVLDTLARMV